MTAHLWKKPEAVSTKAETARHGTPRALLALLEGMRPRHWVKNGVVFAGLVFAQEMLNLPSVLISLSAFAIFCALSSSVYLINDIADMRKDAAHPTKRNRPLPSGRLSVGAAALWAGGLAAIGLGVSGLINLPFFLMAAGYFALNLAYSFALKNMLILDVFSVAAGFVIRAAAGAEAIRVDISPWLLVCSLLLALFLALSKRRHELVLLSEAAESHRSILAHYSPYLLDQMIAVVTASTLVTYTLYTMWPDTVQKFGTTGMVYTVPFVIFGIFRYLYLVHRREQGGSPERSLVLDIPMLVNVVLWLLVSVLVLYYFGGRLAEPGHGLG
jgi:4-hydroxybenzoate polyprenyltransferase